MDKNLIYSNHKNIFDFSLTLKSSIFDFKLEWDAYRLMVGTKLYALISNHNGNDIIILKGLPEENEFMIKSFKSVSPGYHMNKQHWFTINLDQNEFSEEQLFNLIKQSYKLVVSKLSKKMQRELYLI